MLNLRRNGEYQTLEWNGQEGKYLNKEGSFTFDGECNTVFIFDVECGLSWECYIEKDKSGRVHFVCYANGYDENGETVICDFDATNILLNNV